MFLSHFSTFFPPPFLQIALVSEHKMIGRPLISHAGNVYQPQVVQGRAKANLGLLVPASRSLYMSSRVVWLLSLILKTSKIFRWTYSTS